MKIDILEIAGFELDEAITYYEAQQSKLGKRFYEEFKSVLERMSRFPESCQQITFDIRQCLFKSFPYSVIYQIRSERLLVVSISHHHRKPYHWKDRL